MFEIKLFLWGTYLVLLLVWKQLKDEAEERERHQKALEEYYKPGGEYDRIMNLFN